MDNNIKIVIAKDFSDTPGARYKTDGPFSGEQFLEEILLPKFKEAIKKDCFVEIYLDDVWGYPSSFISGSFGKLAKDYTSEEVLTHIKLISESDPLLVEKITSVIIKPDLI